MTSTDDFPARVEALLDAIKSSPPAPGGAGVLAPGEPEAATAERRGRKGIPVSAALWASLVEAAESVGVVLEKEDHHVV
jgi:hydroxycarboxylate dehydrogenase B